MIRYFTLIFIILQIIYLDTKCQTFDGFLGSKSLRWNNEQKDFNALPRGGIDDMSIKLWDNYYGPSAPSNWGSLLEISGKIGHLVSQLYFEGNWGSSRISYRSAFYSENTWSDWKYLLDSKSNVESSGNLLISGTGNHYFSQGNVGIGTTNPTEKLSVNGKIRAHEIKVETSNWPDYVFEEDYPLISLSALEKFIKANKHLPEVPSATEIEKNGLDLGKTQTLFLKKLEELTLILIDKDKQLQKQQQELNEVKEQLRLLFEKQKQ